MGKPKLPGRRDALGSLNASDQLDDAIRRGTSTFAKLQSIAASFNVEAKSSMRKSTLMDMSIEFKENAIGEIEPIEIEFDPDESVMCMTNPSFFSLDHDEVPWEEKSFKDLPWWDYPDLTEDDEMTALVKRVLIAGTKKKCKNQEIYADRIQALVIEFALKVQKRVKERGKDFPSPESKKKKKVEKSEKKDKKEKKEKKVSFLSHHTPHDF
jgi:hypothetical protein